MFGRGELKSMSEEETQLSESLASSAPRVSSSLCFKMGLRCMHVHMYAQMKLPGGVLINNEIKKPKNNNGERLLIS